MILDRLTNRVLSVHVSKYYLGYAVKDLDRRLYLRCGGRCMHPHHSESHLAIKRADGLLRGVLGAFNPGYVLVDDWSGVKRDITLLKWQAAYIVGWLDCLLDKNYPDTLVFPIRTLSVPKGGLLRKTAKMMRQYYPQGQLLFGKPATKLLASHKQEPQVWATAMIRYWWKNHFHRIPDHLRMEPSPSAIKYKERLSLMIQKGLPFNRVKRGSKFRT